MRKRCVSIQRAGVEWFFQPDDTNLGEHWKSRGRGSHVSAEDLANVHHQQAFTPESFPCGLKVIIVGLQVAAADRAPAEFHRAKVLRARCVRTLVGLGWGISEQLRSIGELAVALRIPQEFP